MTAHQPATLPTKETLFLSSESVDTCISITKQPSIGVRINRHQRISGSTQCLLHDNRYYFYMQPVNDKCKSANSSEKTVYCV